MNARGGGESGTTLGRSIGALVGLALGDALGMPTQELTRPEIVEHFGPLVTTFEAPLADHPFAAGLAPGTVTDDTEQALLVAALLIECAGGFDPAIFAHRLLEWEADVVRRGLMDLLGPSTKRALLNLERGMDVAESGRYGTTNGAAMRVGPVGIVRASADVAALVDLVVSVSELTHNTDVALGAACAVAGAVSAGIDGASVDGAIALALRAAALGEQRGVGTGGASIVSQIERAVQLGRSGDGAVLIERIGSSIGTSLASSESVPAAFAVLAANPDDAWRACCVGASLGGDCDTIAAMTGTMIGACRGVDAFPSWAVDKVQTVNGLALADVARRLLELRR